MATPEAVAEKRELAGINADYKEKFGFHDSESGYAYKAPKGLSREVVESISEYKDEPQWMRDFRLKALEHFYERPTPKWGGNLGQIDFDDIHYFVRASEKNSRDWSEVPEDIKNTFDRLGIPEAERKFLSGVGAQYESEVVYHQVNEKLEAQGVIFTDMDTALREHEDLVREHWATIIPANDNKLAALNSAVWSGGSFVYVPAGVKVEMPLQAYFRINTENMGQFERTLIICEEGADVHYIEGCTAPVYSSDSLHSAVVEIVAKKSSRVRYTTVQNWSQNVFNLVTKRAVAHEKATMEWVDCNLGSKLTMKYPSIYLLGPEAHGEILSIAFAGEGQHQDAGGKIIHAAPRTSSSIFSKSISKDGGRATYRGLLEVADGATESRSKVVCDALLLDEDSRSDTYPTIRIDENDADVGHEATVSKIGDEQLFYLAEPRARRGGGLEDDRQRLHRAGHQRAADGVRGRAQPADRAADGGVNWLAREASAQRLSRALPDQKTKGWEFTDLSGLDLDSYEPASPDASIEAAEGATVLPLAEAAESHAGAASRAGSGRWCRPRTRSSPATRRAGAAASSSTSRRGQARRADQGRAAARRGRRGDRLAHADRARGGRRGRGLGALLLARRRDRRAAQLGRRAARRPGGDPALRQHPGHLRGLLDLLHPARRGRARRAPRLDRARLRLGQRQGADGDQARRAGLRGAGHRRLRQRPGPAPRLRHDPGARRPEHLLRPRLPRRPRRRLDRGLARDDPRRPRRPGTDAFQECRNLLLSPEAHADAIPGLEIEADDVRCTHAAAIAQIDKEQLFYLTSRGLDPAEAKSLIIEGFLESLVERLAEGPVRDEISAALERRLAEIL